MPVEVNNIAGQCHRLHAIPIASQEAQAREMLFVRLLNQS